MENAPLSEREIEILQLVSQGKSNKEIAAELFISVNTVKVHLANIFTKIDVSSRTEATLYAIEYGIVASPANASAEPGTNNEIQPEAIEPNHFQLFMQKYWWSIALVALVLILGLSSLLANTPLFAAPTETPNPYLSELYQQRWQELASMSVPRAGLAAASYSNGIYAIAGQTSEGPTNLVERFDPQTNTWTKLADKPTAVSEVSAVVLGEKIYVPGGMLANGQVINRLEVFDPRKGSWESKAELPLAVSGYALATYEGQMYLFGGWNGKQVVDQAWRYDPFNDEWHAAANLPSARAYATAAEVSGKIFVMGGWDGTQDLQESLSFDPAHDLEGEPAWQKAIDLPEACSDCGAESISGMLFVIGQNAIWQLNYPYADWIQIPFNTIPSGQHGFSSVISPDGYLYFIGGWDENSMPLITFYRFRVVYMISVPNVVK
jgi:DNA-binding CsgD family transcriptional regulator